MDNCFLSCSEKLETFPLRMVEVTLGHIFFFLGGGRVYFKGACEVTERTHSHLNRTSKKYAPHAFCDSTNIKYFLKIAVQIPQLL